jgi:hypothetical protein
MSKYVSKKDKFLRILGFSVCISALLGILAEMFIDTSTAFWIFIFSFVYFLLIFLFLYKTKNLHFNVLIQQHHIEKVIYKIEHNIIDLPASKAFFWIGTAILALAMVFFTFQRNYVFTLLLFMLFAINYIYFFRHKITIYFTKTGLAIDYGHWITMTRWDEFDRVETKGRHARFYLKEKKVHRSIPIDNKKEFNKVVKKFVKIVKN